MTGFVLGEEIWVKSRLNSHLKRQSHTWVVMMGNTSDKKRDSLKPPCPICLNVIAGTNCAVTDCGHHFHLHCICKHMFLSYSGRKCPICRAALPDIREIHPPSFMRPTQLPTSGHQVQISGTTPAFLQMHRRPALLNTIIERRMQAGRRLSPTHRPRHVRQKERKMRRLKRMLESNVSY